MFLNDFFYLPRSDRRVIFTLLVIGVVLCGLYLCFGSNDNNESQKVALSDTIRKAEQNLGKSVGNIDYYYDDKSDRVVERFSFDPNTADSSQLLRLGLSKWQVKNIYKYRNKGGVFRSREDFSRIYGLTEKQYRELEPYIRISSDYQQARARWAEYKGNEYVRDSIKYPVKLKFGETISLNNSDTIELKKVPGIGSGFARAIVSYRNRLGGFYDVTQLAEIDGLPDEALDYFRNDHAPVKKIAINKLNVNQLRKHPYINFYQAKAIVDFRRLRGDVQDLSDLRLLKEFTNDDINRLRHYVAY